MKKILIILALAILITSCATKSDITAVNADGSPLWINQTPQNNHYIYGVGYGKLVSPANSKLKAEAASRDAIARSAESSISSSLISFANEAGEKDNTQLLEAFETLSIQITEISLKGILVEATYVDKDGGYYVLSSYPKKQLKEAYENKVKKYEDNLKLELSKIDAENEFYEAIENLVNKIDADKMTDIFEQVIGFTE